MFFSDYNVSSRLCSATILFVLLNILSCSHHPEVATHGIFAPSRLDSVIGQDGVCSIQFSDSITLWTFADTLTGKWKSEKGRLEGNKGEALIEGMLSNSIAWSEKITKENFSGIRLDFYKEQGIVSQFIKNKKHENPHKHRFWALDGFRSGDKVYVFYLHVYVPDHTKFLEFEVLNVGLARWDIPTGWNPGDRIEFRRLGQLFDKGSPYFGAAVMVKDGYVYIAGHFKKNALEFPLSIAKVKIDDVENSGRYSFLSVNGLWTSDIKNAGEFIGDVSGECSLSYNNFLEEYVIIYSKVFTGDIGMVRFKEFCKLPSAEKTVVYNINKQDVSKMWPYSAKEIFSSGRSIYLIYIDPVNYQPLLVELKF